MYVIVIEFLIKVIGKEDEVENNKVPSNSNLSEERVQHEIDQINKELQEELDYQEVEPEEMDYEGEESKREHSESYIKVLNKPMPITIEEISN